MNKIKDTVWNMSMKNNILRLEDKKKNTIKNKNRGGECESWKRSTSPPRSTYSDVI